MQASQQCMPCYSAHSGDCDCDGFGDRHRSVLILRETSQLGKIIRKGGCLAMPRQGWAMREPHPRSRTEDRKTEETLPPQESFRFSRG